MRNQSPRPWELKALPLLFLLWGGLHILHNVVRWGPAGFFGEWVDDTLEMDLGPLVLLAAFGLWRRWPLSRKFAVFLTWYWGLGAVHLLLRVYPVRGVRWEASPPILRDVPDAFLRYTLAPFLVIQLWQYYTLKRDDIKALFYPPVRAQLPGMPDAGPLTQAAEPRVPSAFSPVSR
jgi:hypothetical protein